VLQRPGGEDLVGGPSTSTETVGAPAVACSPQAVAVVRARRRADPPTSVPCYHRVST